MGLFQNIKQEFSMVSSHLGSEMGEQTAQTK